MRYASHVKPISYLKANAAELLKEIAATREPLAITQNGEVRAVLQDVASFDETQETLTLLKLLALGMQDIDAGDTRPAHEAIAAIRKSQPAP
jgi:prevent-host-death family protein